MTRSPGRGLGPAGNTPGAGAPVQVFEPPSPPEPHWQALSGPPAAYANGMWLMQGGHVLVNTTGTTELYSLAPDASGSYANLASTKVGNFLAVKFQFAAGVLSDGRLVTCGGEHTGPTGQGPGDTNFCEIYDPITGTAKQFTQPSGWSNIGDSPSVFRPDGTFMLGNAVGFGTQVALLDAKTLTWSFGQGDQANEQGYVLLQTGDVLTVNPDTQVVKRYSSSANAFQVDAALPAPLGRKGEIGPGVTLLDGRVIWFGATANTCIYVPNLNGENGQWVQGPSLPVGSDGTQWCASDVPALLLPNGRVLVLLRALDGSGTAFGQFDPALNSCTLLTKAPADTGGTANMLLLPSGEALVSCWNGKWYLVSCHYLPDFWIDPTLSSYPATASRNSTITVSGYQLCGLSECSSFGDDIQQAENYPLVRLTSADGSTVRYCRTHDVSTRSIARGQFSTVQVDIPGDLVPDSYYIQAVAMGRGSSTWRRAASGEPESTIIQIT
jgi:hypothetical protein